MTKRVSWVLLSALLIFTLVLSACGGGAQQTQEVPGTGGTAPAATEPLATAMQTSPAATEPVATEPSAATQPAGTQAAGTQPAGGGEQIGGTVSVLAVWGGEELDNFNAMIEPFKQRTGIQVEYEGTRDLNAVLTTRIQGGNPPDLAGLPGPGQLREYARAGNLVALNDVLDMTAMQEQYDPGFLNLATVNDQLYGIFIKAAVKSLVWYNPKAFEEKGYQVPTTWDEMIALSNQIVQDGGKPWCIGLESGAASGWPGTDWIEDIMLRTAGPDKYDQWWQHQIPWTDDSVKNAWNTWGEIVNNPDYVFGGQQAVLSTNFGQSPFPMFENPPGCYMHRQASFITSFITEQYPDMNVDEDLAFFVFPPINADLGNPLLVGGDLFGMFNDTPQARALIQYMATAEAQEIWAGRGGFLSANKQVDPSVYPDKFSQQFGQMLAEADAVRFDASDLMPEAVNNAFWTGILNFVSDPGSLDSVLETIESTAQDAYTQQ